jgi:hypothetical protein
MLKLRSIGLSDYSVLEGRQRIGRIGSVLARRGIGTTCAVLRRLTGGVLPTPASARVPA